MSARTWLKEFYPKNADSVKQGPAGIRAIAATEHSLQKWLGLRKSSLKKHGIGEPPIDTCASTCALCRCYYRSQLDEPCEGCPIYRVTKKSCEKQFDAWQFDNKTAPMIATLRRVLKALIKEIT